MVENAKEQTGRRELLKKVLYVAPAVLTLAILPDYSGLTVSANKKGE